MVEKTLNGAKLSALSRIREVTSGAHASLESALDLPNIDLLRYRNVIADFFGYYQPLEKLTDCYSQPNWLDGFDRRKTRYLQSDLMSLGLSQDAIDALPRCSQLPPATTVPQQLGCMYVLEGSTLGGQHVARRLLPALGLRSDHGGSFFSSYGADVGMRWRGFLDRLEMLLPDDDAKDAAAQSASRTFESLQAWFTRPKPADLTNEF